MDIFVCSHKIRMKHFGYKFSHIENSAPSSLSTQVPSSIWERGRAYKYSRGDKMRTREKHCIYHSLPSTLCWQMLLLGLWSLVLIAWDSTATVHGPVVTFHNQNSQAPLCFNPDCQPTFRLPGIPQAFSLLSWELRKFDMLHLATSKEIWKALSDSGLLNTTSSALGILYHGSCSHSPMTPQIYQHNEVWLFSSLRPSCLTEHGPVGSWKNTII